jgi:hypothetical protein
MNLRPVRAGSIAMEGCCGAAVASDGPGGFDMAFLKPNVGDWYRLNGGELFEVVAVDEDDGTIEIQYFDGTVQEMEVEDWDDSCEERALEAAEPPEDWSGSVDVEPDEDSNSRSDPYSDERDLRASALDGIDIFE